MEYVIKSKAAIRDVASLLMKENGDVSFSTPATVSTPTTVSTTATTSTNTLVTSNSSPSRVLNIYGGVFHGAFTYNA